MSAKRTMLYALIAACLVFVLAALGACTAPEPEVITQIVTQIVKEIQEVQVEGETVIKEVEVEKEVEVIVTATPEPSAPGVLRAIPRDKTWIIGGWEFTANLAGSDNFNPYMNIASLRTNYSKFVYEALMYSNLNTGEEYPWLAESYDVDDDYLGMTIYLRKGVEWADGESMTCDDVQYSILTLRDTDAAGGQHGYFMQWVDDVACIDDFTVRIDYTGANPRFHQRIMVGHENQFVIVPKHIFETKDVATFTNLDLGVGFPMGSGPYKLVLVTAQQAIYDRRDDWWGAKVGFMDLPAPERIVVTTAASDQVLAEQYICDRIDYGGFALQVGSFEAAKEKNPNMRSWFAEGPAYGAADGCVYQMALNNAKYDDANVRIAMNYAIDRQQVADLAYQGATFGKVVPISEYVFGAWESVLKPLLDEYDRDAPSQAKVDEHMELAGYEKNADGIWEKDGEVLSIVITVPQPWATLGPVLAEQLTKAGFDAEESLDTAGQWAPMWQNGEADAVAFVHCGSLYDPYDTMSQFHSKHNSPIGDTDNLGGGIFGYTRFPGTAEMDAALDMMEATPPDPSNPQYVEWVKTAVETYLAEMPTIVLAEELHVVTMNETYWTGYPTSDDPYVAPYPCWNDFTYVVFKVQPVD